MKRLFWMLITCMLLVWATALAAAQSKSKNIAFDKSRAEEKTVVGHIGDAMCGLDHPETVHTMGDAKMCTLKCVEGGSSFILADRDHGVVYSLVHAKSQKQAKKFAGQKVRLKGLVDAKAKAIEVIEIKKAG